MTPTDLLANRPHTWWASPTVTLAGFGAKTILDPGVGEDRFGRAQELADDYPVAFVSFTFDSQVGRSLVVLPETVVEIAEGSVRTYGPEVDLTTRSTLSARHDRPRFAGSSLPDQLWLEAVGEVIDLIESGIVQKVVLARDHALWSKEPFDPYRVLSHLHQRFASCYLFLVEGLVGASPELLIRRQGPAIDSVTLAGTVARGGNEEEDRMLAKELANSIKTKEEHRLAAVQVRRNLERVTSNLSFPPVPEILALDNVQHLATPFRGHLDRDRHVLDLVALLHPTPAVGGVPVDGALSIIDRMEGMDRNRYAGPVGYFRPNGDGEFAIALRCAELSGARARLFAGNGIVAGSIPEDELEETRLKLRAMLSALE